MSEMNVGDTLSVRDLIAAWRTDLIAGGADTVAAERSRIAQAAFGIDLSGDPPELAQAWMPDWVRDRTEFDEDRVRNGPLLALLAREWAVLTQGADPFAGMIEAPFVIGALWERYATDGRTPDIDAMVTELVCALWNIDPSSTTRVTTAAMYRAGPAARIVKSSPGDEEPIACPQCGWAGVVGETGIEYGSMVSHRECPRCEKILLIL